MMLVVGLLMMMVYQSSALMRDDEFLTPYGPVPSRCVTRLPQSGAFIRGVDEATDMLRIDIEGQDQPLLIPQCKGWKPERKRKNPAPNTYDGWLAYTSFQNPSSLTTFLGYFSVPDEPQSAPQVLYVFTGLQNVDWIPIVDPPPSEFDIIQPVLQYPGDYGNYWSVRSWYVTLKYGVQVSDEVQVATGDNIYGNMTSLGSDTWYIGGGASGGQVTSITVSHNVLTSQPWAYTTVECYGCSGCSTEPTQPIKFTQMTLTDASGSVSPTWQAFQSPNPICNTRAVINSPSSVTYDFGS